MLLGKWKLSICRASIFAASPTRQSFLSLFNSIEILMLTVCKCQKWKKKIKVGLDWKIRRLSPETVTLVRFWNQKITAQFYRLDYESLYGGVDARSMQNFHTFSLKFSVFYSPQIFGDN